MKVWSLFAAAFVLAVFFIMSSAGQQEEPQCQEGGSQEGSTATATATSTVFAPLGKPSEFTASSTGVKLAVRRWLPEKDEDVKSVVVFVHGGAGWHSGYSDILGNFLKDNGIAFVTYDQAGSGYSEGIDGYRVYFDSMDTNANDFTKMYQDTRQKYPGKKVFAMGESFGCMILMHQILKEQRAGNDAALADGYVFSGPVVQVLPEMLPSPPVRFIIKVVAKFFPLLSTPGTDFFSTFDLAFGDKRWAQAGRADPFIQEAANIPPKLGPVSNLLSSMVDLNDSLDEIAVPFKIFMGEHEGRVDVAAIHKLHELAKSKDKSMEIVKGGYHQLYQDLPEVTRSVCNGVKDWILARS